MLRCQETVVLTMLVPHTGVARNSEREMSQNAPGRKHTDQPELHSQDSAWYNGK